jgi:hypothetical protein
MLELLLFLFFCFFFFFFFFFLAWDYHVYSVARLNAQNCVNLINLSFFPQTVCPHWGFFRQVKGRGLIGVRALAPGIFPESARVAMSMLVQSLHSGVDLGVRHFSCKFSHKKALSEMSVRISTAQARAKCGSKFASGSCLVAVLRRPRQIFLRCPCAFRLRKLA